nr:retrovirus-related Pol polyprotein from transposon TNT 1-94 [Tanacetum cinerariifolium]
MVAILEKGEFNSDFHPMVDFIAASHLRYALTVKPTIFVSHIRQFWSTARIETIDEGTHILATVDGTPTKPHHTPFPEADTSHLTTSLIPLPSIPTAPIPPITQPDTTSIRQYTRRVWIAQSSALSTVADEPASLVRDVSEGEACPTDSGFIADQDRATIAKSSTLPHDSAPRVTSPAADKGSMQHNISKLTALCTSLQRQYSELQVKFQAQEEEIVKLKDRVKVLEDKEDVAATHSGDDAPIKGRSINEGEVATERITSTLKASSRKIIRINKRFNPTYTVYQMDEKSAFLYGTINEEVYVMQPPGFQDPKFPAKVYKVEKAMYGLHQAPRAWYGKLSKYLLKNGFQRGTIDQTLFIRKQREYFILVQVYVDDIIFGSSNPQLCREFEAPMHEKFQISDMGELNFFLGLQVLQKEDDIILSQDKYVGDILKKFGYSNVRSSNTPMDKENPWGKDRTGKDVDLHLYRSMIGSLIDCFEKKLINVDHIHIDENVADLLTKPFDAGRFQYLVCKLFPLLGKLSIVSVFLGFGLTFAGTSKFLGVLRILMISLTLIPLGEHNVNFHSIVDFIEASPLRYALTVKPTVYVSHIRRFWSTARIETTEEGTKILATVDSIVRTISESSLRRNLKLRDEEGISSLLDAELFENLTLMGYNISPNQKFTFQKGSGTPTEPHYTPSPKAPSPSHTTHTSPSLLPAQEVEINRLKERVKLLEEREGLAAKSSGDDAPIKGRSIDEEEATTERISDDSEEMATVLTSMDAAIVLASGVINVPTGSGPITTASTPAEGLVPTGSEEVPTASLVLATATVVTPVTRRNGKEVMVESETPKKQKVQEQIDAQVARELEEQLEREDQRKAKQIAKDAEVARIHVEEELQSIIDGLDSNNETISKYLQEYHWFSSELPIERRVELISDLVKSGSKVQFSLKADGRFYTYGSKEEAERIKRKGINLEQESAKKHKTSKEVTEEAKSPKEVTKEKVKEMMQLVPIEEVYVEALQVKHPIID